MHGIYSVPVEETRFENFCGGNLGGEHETCVEIATIPGFAAGFAVRDSKPEGAGHELRFTADELDTFALGWAKRQGLTLGA
ncbi:DUF397 domain-containing protein [Streptomyces sp. NPDC001985]|uniref:DUF397 domain-containing protein n=1 Tax=Streptomyces sp. NPDC001985 TaxID=3154406 RepID=UPI00332C4D03